MARLSALLAILLLVASCDRQAPPGNRAVPAPPGTAVLMPKGRVQELLKADAKLVGYLYSPDQPYVIAGFSNGELQWRSDPQSKSSVQGHADVFSWPDRSCVGFEQKNLFMPTHGPERYLVCEALQRIEHRNNLPRSQDFVFSRGALFLEYQPPRGTGFPQIYYFIEQK